MIHFLFLAILALARFEECPDLTGLYRDYFNNQIRVEQKVEEGHLVYVAHYAGGATAKFTVGDHRPQGGGFVYTYCENGAVIIHNHGAGSLNWRRTNQIYPSNVKDEGAIEKLITECRQRGEPLAFTQDVSYRMFLAGKDFETDMTSDILYQNLITGRVYSFREQTVQRLVRIPEE